MNKMIKWVRKYQLYGNDTYDVMYQSGRLYTFCEKCPETVASFIANAGRRTEQVDMLHGPETIYETCADPWEKIGGPELSFEISECGMSLDNVIGLVEKSYPGWKFNRTESRYQSCVMAIFEKKA